MFSLSLLVPLLLFIVLPAAAMAIASRVCGGGLFSVPFGLAEPIYAIPFGYAAFVLTTGLPLYFSIPLIVLSFGLAFLGKRLGHGQYFDLGTTKKLMLTPDGKPRYERIDPFVQLFFGIDPNNIREGEGNYWRDFFGLFVTGIVVGLGLAIAAFVTGNILFGVLALAATGAKCLAYAIGRIFSYSHATEIGEYLTGFINGLAVFAIIFFG